MCLTVPMRIVSVVGQIACCEAGGTRRDVNLALLADTYMAVGDHVLVHAGCALQRVTAIDAHLTGICSMKLSLRWMSPEHELAACVSGRRAAIGIFRAFP